MPTRKKSIAKYTMVEKRLHAAMENLEAAWIASEGAVAVRSKDAKSLTSTVKRLSKKHATLNKRKTTASGRLKKAPSPETRAALRSVVQDLTKTKKELVKAKAAKAANAEELNPLKTAYRRAHAYAAAIQKVDKQLDKPTKKRRS